MRKATCRWALYFLIFLTLLSALIIFSSNRELPQTAINQLSNPETYGYYEDLPKEYTPIWATEPEKITASFPHERVSVLSGKASARTVSWQPENRVIEAHVETPALLRVATTYYPGWTAVTGGGKQQIFVEKATGAMLLRLRPGDQVITLSFSDTPVRRAAKFVTLLSSLLLCLYTMKTWFKKLKGLREVCIRSIP